MMALGMGGSKSLQNIGMVLILFASLFSAPTIWAKFKSDPLFYLVISFLFYLIIRTIFAQYELPAWTEDHWDRARRMSRIILLPLVAFWITQKKNALAFIFILFGIGVMAAIFQGVWENGGIQFLFDGRRIRFNLNPQRMGYVTGLTLLGLMIYRQNILSFFSKHFHVYLALAVWLLCLLAIFQAFLVSQARAALLGLIIISPILLAIVVISAFYKISSVKLKAYSLISIFAVLMLLIWIAVLQRGNLENRFKAEGDVIGQILEGDTEDIRLSGIGIRVYLWKIGINAWLEKPAFGWGTDGARRIISKNDNPEVIKRFNHFHNTYVDILVRFGAAGMLIMGFIAVQLVLGLWTGYSKKRASNHTAILLSSGFLFFLLVNVTETHLVPSWGWFMLSLLGGSMYSFKLSVNNS